MRISFALGHELPFPPTRGGGVNSLLENLCDALVGDGHEVTAYSPQTTGHPQREISNGITHIRLKGAGRRKNNVLNALCGMPYALALRSTLTTCDVLSCHMLHSFLFASSRSARVVTQTLHRDPKFFLGLYGGLDRIYTASEAVSAQARLVAPQIANKVQTIHNCVDFRGYELVTPHPSTPLRFIFVGRFSEDKGVDGLIRAFGASIRRNPRIQLTLVGPIEAKDGGDERLLEKCRAYIDAEGFAEKIQILPPIFDRILLDQRIRENDVVCLPSVRGETLNMSVIESMRLAKCILVSDLPANAPLVKQNHNGLFARAGDESDWSEKILHLAANPSRVVEFGVNSFHYGQETFSATRIARDYVRDFDGLLKKSKR